MAAQAFVVPSVVTVPPTYSPIVDLGAAQSFTERSFSCVANATTMGGGSQSPPDSVNVYASQDNFVTDSTLIGSVSAGVNGMGVAILPTIARYYRVARTSIQSPASPSVASWVGDAVASGTTPSYSPAYLMQTAWYVDGSNVTGRASDNNSGATALAPLLTFAEWTRRTGGGPTVPSAVFMLSNSLIGDPFTPAANRPIISGACVMLSGEQGRTTLYSSSGATAVQAAQPQLVILSATTATPIVCAHNGSTYAPQTGDRVVIAGATGQTVMNNTWTITRIDATHFSLNTSVGSGAYTASSATATFPNVPWSFTDSALPGTWSNSGPAASTLVAYRIRWPSTGAIAWGVKDLGSKSIRITPPNINFTTLPSQAVPAPAVGAPTTIAADVPYVVEALPILADLIPALAVSGNVLDGLGCKVMYVGVAVPGYHNTADANVSQVIAGAQALVQWYGCDTTVIGGTATFVACLTGTFANFTGNGYWIGCAIMGGLFVEAGASASIGNGSICQCEATFGAVSGITANPGSHLELDASPYPLGVFDSTDVGVYVSAGASCTATNVFGTGNGTYGFKVQGPGGTVALGGAALPTIVGATNDTLIGGVAVTWATLSGGGHTAANGASMWPLL